MSRRRLSPFRMPRRSWQAVFVFILLLGVAAVQQWRPELFQSLVPRTSEQATSQTYRIERVVDGDTFVLADSKERLRLIGADTPETVKPNWPVEPWGPEATAFTKEFLSSGEMRLEFDGPRRDKYGRLLAFVWVDDQMLNEELIRAGLARAELKYPYSADMKTRFRRAEAEARAAHIGIWSAKKEATDGHR